MFFTLSTQPDNRFPYHETVGNWVFSHDDGWLNDNGVWHKGYTSPGLQHGNWTQLTTIDDNLLIQHDKHRAYPLWWDNSTKILTNLLGTGKSIWADGQIYLTQDHQLVQETIDVYGNILTNPLPVDQVVKVIADNLIAKIQSLATHYSTVPKRLFVTGGVDTVLLYALVKNQDIDCEIVTYEHLEYNSFIDLNIENIRRAHWGYNQIHHWNQQCLLMTGGCGDEFFMRGPANLGLWAAWHDINLNQLLSEQSGYHVGYFIKSVNRDIISQHYDQREAVRAQYPTKELLVQQILNMNVNDHQHWHLGNTLTWTPFKDLEITKTVLRLSEQDMLSQVIDATLNKKIIQHLWPEAMSLLSCTKNYNNRENLSSLY